MKNTIRCCISCILPCGALDVIRIVHSNGRVEEFSQTIRASDIMKANPKHVLRKPTSGSSEEGIVQKIVVVPPEAELQRGKIYFLIPVANDSTDQKNSSSRRSSGTAAGTRSRKKKRDQVSSENMVIRRRHHRHPSATSSNTPNMTNNSKHFDDLSDQYLTEILSENKSTQLSRDRRRGRVGVWRPHLESISESD